MNEKFEKPKKPLSEWTDADFAQAEKAIKQHAELTGGIDELGNEHYSYGNSLQDQTDFDLYRENHPLLDEQTAKLSYRKHLDSLHMKKSVEPKNAVGHRTYLPTGDGCLSGLYNLITGRKK